MPDPGNDWNEWLDAMGRVRVAPSRRGPPEEADRTRLLDQLREAKAFCAVANHFHAVEWLEKQLQRLTPPTD